MDFCSSAILLKCAQDFYDAAQLAKGDDPYGNVTLPVRYLIAHAIELILKAYLRATGATIEELRDKKKLGHDLMRLLGEAEKCGLRDHTSLTADDRNIIANLNTYYSSKELEYYVAGKTRFHSFRLINDVAEKLIEDLKSVCWAGRNVHDGKKSVFTPKWVKET